MSRPATKCCASPPWTGADELASGKGAGAKAARAGACGLWKLGPTAQPLNTPTAGANSRTMAEQRVADIPRLPIQKAQATARPPKPEGGGLILLKDAQPWVL